MTFTRASLRIRLLYFSPGCISLHAALFFSLRLGSLAVLSMLRMNSYLYIFNGLFCLTRANARLRLVLWRVFFFLLHFVYLFRTPLS